MRKTVMSMRVEFVTICWVYIFKIIHLLFAILLLKSMSYLTKVAKSCSIKLGITLIKKPTSMIIKN